MVQVKLFNQTGNEAGNIELSDEIFAIEPNENAITDTILMIRASKRQGTHATKNRSAVRGGGRKPWRQKGTGRARQGSIRSPQWVGGGTVFGPTPRSYAYKLPRKVRRLALRSALSRKVANDQLIVIDELQFDAPKTKDFKKLLDTVGADKKALVVIDKDNENAVRSARNLAQATLVDENHVNVYDLENSDKVIITRSALSNIEEALA